MDDDKQKNDSDEIKAAKINSKSVILAALITGPLVLLLGILISNWDKIFPHRPDLIPPSLSQGEWEIIEKVTIREKNIDIVWKYIPSIKDNTLELIGRKIKVNYAEPTPGEKIATSVCSLKFKGSQAEGECKESNANHDVLRTNVKMNFEDNFTSVTGYFENNGRRGPKLTGTKS